MKTLAIVLAAVLFGVCANADEPVSLSMVTVQWPAGIGDVTTGHVAGGHAREYMVWE